MGEDREVGATIHFEGIVQGVGFRPYVYAKAVRFSLKGTVQNTDRGVFIRVDGKKENIDSFYHWILERPPVRAEIHRSSITYHDLEGFKFFKIIKSEEGSGGFTPVSPDIATCEECLGEVFNPHDRRFRYPFTNCTNCGPRFTIIRAIPYDRKNTTMSVFSMCDDCLIEYEDPLNRRYHAQPNACPSCGPHLTLLKTQGEVLRGDPVKEAVGILKKGEILAIKGIGGYHLAVEPRNDSAVKLLRERKKRPAKPFALMVRDINVVKKYCFLDEEAEGLLKSFERPIVLLKKKDRSDLLSSEVAPDTNFLGLMLPYSPLQQILFDEGPEILIMTSANLSEEPLVFQDSDAFEELAPITDAFLTHNREIERPCDDSVMTVIDGTIQTIRRSRGYVPRAIEIGISKRELLSLGASEKNTFCVFKNGKAFPSHHIGDLNNEKSVDAYIQGILDFLDMFRVKPEAVACDLHPDYFSTLHARKLSEDWGVPLFSIQHHHAHIASVLGEKGVKEMVIGVAFDGTGYGEDGTLWGGEFLVADTKKYVRAGHFAKVLMPGGEKSIVEIDRMGLSYLKSAYGSLKSVPSFPFLNGMDNEKINTFEKVMELKFNTPLTSSCGRLFDGVSAILGLCNKPAYDAQGAILLEREACDMDDLMSPYTYTMDGEKVLHFETMIREIVEDIRKGISKKTISRRFHSTIVLSSVEICKEIREELKINIIVLSGGAFQNRILLRYFFKQLENAGFTVLTNSIVPPNDGGISIGQGVIALNQLEGGKD